MKVFRLPPFRYGELQQVAVTDPEGNFLFKGLKPGFAELRVSSVGFRTYISAASWLQTAML